MQIGEYGNVQRATRYDFGRQHRPETAFGRKTSLDSAVQLHRLNHKERA
jgi:hypothetical protein